MAACLTAKLPVYSTFLQVTLLYLGFDVKKTKQSKTENDILNTGSRVTEDKLIQQMNDNVWVILDIHT